MTQPFHNDVLSPKLCDISRKDTSRLVRRLQTGFVALYLTFFFLAPRSKEKKCQIKCDKPSLKPSDYLPTCHIFMTQLPHHRQKTKSLSYLRERKLTRRYPGVPILGKTRQFRRKMNSLHFCHFLLILCIHPFHFVS